MNNSSLKDAIVIFGGGCTGDRFARRTAVHQSPLRLRVDPVAFVRGARLPQERFLGHVARRKSCRLQDSRCALYPPDRRCDAGRAGRRADIAGGGEREELVAGQVKPFRNASPGRIPVWMSRSSPFRGATSISPS